MKNVSFTLTVTLVFIGGLVFANRDGKRKTQEKSIHKERSAADRNDVLKKWEATQDGIFFKKWEASPAGKRVYASEAKIRNSIRDFAEMEGVVSSLSLPPGSKLGFGIMIKIKGNDYILSFGNETPKGNEFQQLRSLKVNDNLLIKSRSVSHAPKYRYPIVAGDYVERNGMILYLRKPRKDGC
jgi:hypothetical protein